MATSICCRKMKIGVLSIQGAVEEHLDAVKAAGAIPVPVHDPSDINDLDGIILPGGESTTMSIVGEKNGLFPKLKEWVNDNKPIWGTCAGMILLSNHAIKKAESGQTLVGGLDVHVCRNYFGSQIQSCVKDIEVPPEVNEVNTQSSTSLGPYPAVFIRAPAILRAGSEVQILSKVTAEAHKFARDEVNKLLNITTDNDNHNNNSHEVIVAVKQGNILATAFHPELTNDLRWHRYFIDMIEKSNKK